jgi:hypothetical protein
MIRWIFVLSVLVPAFTVWASEKAMIQPPDAVNPVTKEWTYVTVGTIAGVGVAMLVGLVATEMLIITPAVYGAVSGFMVGAAIFILGTSGLYWSDYTTYVMLALVAMVFLWYFTSFDRGNALLVGIIAAASFVLVNSAGRAMVVAVEKNKSVGVLNYWARTGLFMVPVVFVFLLWVARVRASGTSVAVPMMFFLFTVIYTILYNPVGLEVDNRLYLPQGSFVQNVGMEFVFAATVFIPMIAIAKFVYIGADTINVQLTGGRVPIAETFVQFSVYTVISFVAAMLFNLTQENQTIKRYIGDAQRQARGLYDAVTYDIANGAAWDKLKVK